MADIVLSTLNAKYIHPAFGLRCLRANLGELRERSTIREFTVHDRPVDIVEQILEQRPRVVGLGVYIWNASESLEVVRILRGVAPAVRIVLGGPEVSHELDDQPLVQLADHVITGEGETAFLQLCRSLLAGRPFLTKVLRGGLPELSELALPYAEYTDEDVKQRVLYVEASRGCPFSCEFCLSSLDEKVRSFPLETFLSAMDGLIARGARQLKFVDRTFNLSMKTAEAILQFVLDRQAAGVFGHFEMVPDRFPEALRSVVQRFAPGALQFEVGIQTFDAETSTRISRKQDVARLEDNLRFLRADTGVHVHADLIIGLPGEDVASFARGFDRLVALAPHEIQVGILKRLRGTPIVRHDAEWNVVWNPAPPYEILHNRLISFAEMQRLKRFARVWDLVANRGHFPGSLPLLWRGQASPFFAFYEFSEWLRQRVSLGGVALPRLAELLLGFVTEVRGVPLEEAGPILAEDYLRSGRGAPPLLEPFAVKLLRPRPRDAPAGLVRQARHRGPD